MVAGSGTPVTLGDWVGVPVGVTIFGLVVTIVMLARKWKGAILLGIVFSTVFATILNYAYDKKSFAPGTAVIPHKAFAAPDFSLVGKFDFSSFTKLGIAATIPIIGGNGFNSPALLKNAGEAADGVMMGASWNATSSLPLNKKFVETFTAKYGNAPDQFAAQAYAGD